MVRVCLGRWPALLLTSLCAVAPQALAQALAIVPINQQLTPQQRSASFTLTNHSDREALVQIRGFAWTQADGSDHYSPAPELVVSPPFAKIAAGQSQVVRFLLRNPAGPVEQAYRIVFDQIPDRLAGQVALALRFTVPVFSSALQAGKADVQWHLALHGGVPTLSASNQGPRHAQLVNLKLSDASGQPLKLREQGLPYVLSGITRRWSLAPAGRALMVGERVHLQTSGPAEHWDQWLILEAQD